MGHTDMLNLTPDGGHPPFPIDPPDTRRVRYEDPPEYKVQKVHLNQKKKTSMLDSIVGSEGITSEVILIDYRALPLIPASSQI